MPNNGEVTPIRVLLVEDSLLQLYVIKALLNSDPHIEVVGTAVNGLEALKLLPDIRPDVICTDYHMPIMDGLEFIEHAVKVYPCPILVLSISVQPNQVDNIFKMLSAGAIDVMPKPKATAGVIGKEEAAKLIEKIRILNGVKYIKKKAAQPLSVFNTQSTLNRFLSPRVIVMGASTGGPQALEAILPYLKSNFSIPIVCIQHISNGFLGGMLVWLQGMTDIVIETAQEGGLPMPGHLYFPPEGKHLVFATDGTFRLIEPKTGDIYCPSIDQLFNSAAQTFSMNVVAVILSGMGKDGAQGIKAVFDAGGGTVAQDGESSIIFGMPSAAIDLGAVCKVVPVSEIASFLNSLPSTS